MVTAVRRTTKTSASGAADDDGRPQDHNDFGRLTEASRDNREQPYLPWVARSARQPVTPVARHSDQLDS